MTWHFEGLKLIFQSFSHLSRASMSLCRISELSCLSGARYMAVSSANNQILDLTGSGRSLIMLIYVRNSIGPKTEPCGTLEDT